MTQPHALQIAPIEASSRTLSPAQKRFNTLMRQIEQARQSLADWAEHAQAYRQAHAAQWLPLQAERLRGLRQWAESLDAQLQRKGWTRAERELLAELVCDAAAEVLASDDSDAAMRALFDRHAEVDYDTDVRQAMLAAKDMAEAMTGLDLGEDEGIDSQNDLLTRLQQRLQAEMAAQAEAQDAAPQPRRRPSAARQRREAEAQQASQSLREIYRKLASALHPDREPDPALREARTAQMQRVNQAYERQDLLGLLALQLEIEQIDAQHVAQASETQLKHYCRLLAEQKDELLDELRRVEWGFRAEFDLEPGLGLKPRQLGRLLEQSVRALRVELAEQQLDQQRLLDQAATKRWLKRLRQQRRDEELDFGFF